MEHDAQMVKEKLIYRIYSVCSQPLRPQRRSLALTITNSAVAHDTASSPVAVDKKKAYELMINDATSPRATLWRASSASSDGYLGDQSACEEPEDWTASRRASVGFEQSMLAQSLELLANGLYISNQTSEANEKAMQIGYADDIRQDQPTAPSTGGYVDAAKPAPARPAIERPPLREALGDFNKRFQTITENIHAFNSSTLVRDKIENNRALIHLYQGSITCSSLLCI